MSGEFFSPFSLKVSPMQRLMLIGFEKDPDEIYIGFEPQWFEDADYGTGLRIIAWRRDGYVDVYQQRGLQKEQRFDVAGKGLLDLIVTDMPHAQFFITSNGVDVYIAFQDKLERNIVIKVIERHPKPKQPFTLLAPVGSGSAKPSALPVYFLYQFDFVRRKHTEVHISIANKTHKPDMFPLPLSGHRVYYMRYAADTFMVDFCPNSKGTLVPVSDDLAERVIQGGITYDINLKDGHPEIACLAARGKQHQINICFDPPFPNIVGLQAEASTEGHFTIEGDQGAGEITGIYKVLKQGANVVISLNPTAWLPQPTTLFLKFLFKVAKIFTTWPQDYSWKSTIQLNGADAVFTSSWEKSQS